MIFSFYNTLLIYEKNTYIYLLYFPKKIKKIHYKNANSLLILTIFYSSKIWLIIFAKCLGPYQYTKILTIIFTTVICLGKISKYFVTFLKISKEKLYQRDEVYIYIPIWFFCTLFFIVFGLIKAHFSCL